MDLDFDVVIVGAGPVGSTIAYYLAQNELNVAIVDKKKQIGYPLQCAGILSKHIFEHNVLPDEIILNTVSGAFLHSQNHILKVRKDENVAYIIDRVGYDQFLLKRALDNGVKLINQKVIDADIENGITYFSKDDYVTSKIIVGCDGYNSKISEVIGNDQRSYPASQMLVRIDGENINNFRNSDENVNDYVDTCLLEEALPGFLWIIPTGDNHYRVGLFSEQPHKQQNEILKGFLDENFESFEIIEKYKGFIPIYDNTNQLVNSRALLIGDAASQIKPTSGGGLLMAFDSCKIAADYIVNALNMNDEGLLKGYETEFRKKYSKEFSYQFKVQKTLNLLDKKDIDYSFTVIFL